MQGHCLTILLLHESFLNLNLPYKIISVYIKTLYYIVRSAFVSIPHRKFLSSVLTTATPHNRRYSRHILSTRYKRLYINKRVVKDEFFFRDPLCGTVSCVYDGQINEGVLRLRKAARKQYYFQLH